ncbi:MAG: phosphatidylglycerophosphatase A [Acidobacteria bacterium]|nr:phosphatidylglycerophosphatase A [Acidobacteriota bacterium]
MKPGKETSDTLSPAVEATTHIAVPARRRTFADYVALALATCGVGFIPVAPGTWGSLVGVALYVGFGGAMNVLLADDSHRLGTLWGGAPVVLISGAEQFRLLRTLALLFLIAAVTLVGIWAATRTEKLIKKKDPGIVVIDEVAGQLLTFLFVPWGAPAWLIFAGFVAFRLFDIWKPYPVRRLEALETGLGIMADDVLAGLYAAALLALVASIATLI